MMDRLIAQYHLHPIVDHFTIAMLSAGCAAEILAAAALLLPSTSIAVRSATRQLRSTSLMLMIGGAAAAVLSYFTGDSEADRLWDSISPRAQHVLISPEGTGQYFSHAILGRYLMYCFLILAVWRLSIELWPRMARWRILFLAAAAIAVGALVYQGKTGGDLVYQYGVGTSSALSR